MPKYFKQTLQREMSKWFKDNLNYWPYRQVYACIYGTPMYLCELEVRFLQLKCKNAYLEGGETAYQDFCANHIVYSGRTKRGHTKMIFRRDGCFENDFESGFMNSNEDLTLKLL